MKNKNVKRIEKMEEILNNANRIMDEIEGKFEELREYQEKIKELEEYYTGDDWKEDFELDEAGELPEDLKRGVLSEDAVYDMLERNKELMTKLLEERTREKISDTDWCIDSCNRCNSAF